MNSTDGRPPDRDVDADSLQALIVAHVETALSDKVNGYKIRFRYFLYGLAGLVLLLIAGGLVGGSEIIRTLHTMAFPIDGINDLPDVSPQLAQLRKELDEEVRQNLDQERRLEQLSQSVQPHLPVISYESTLQLRGDVPGMESAAVYFFATEGQKSTCSRATSPQVF